MQYLKVKDLIAMLKHCDQNACVVLSDSAEGNGYCLMPNKMFITPLGYIANSYRKQETFYEPDTTVKQNNKIIIDLLGNKVDTNDLLKCIVLWPCD